ncbi:MAG: hypothetical protein BWY99_02516 [Synergistetes bacterium ADurb.BinA166]|nr:MAG: hypothetical protein BWY99_02516 [Synergistetes bacterium ADurb.BinA166]
MEERMFESTVAWSAFGRSWMVASVDMGFSTACFTSTSAVICFMVSTRLWSLWSTSFTTYVTAKFSSCS